MPSSSDYLIDELQQETQANEANQAEPLTPNQITARREVTKLAPDAAGRPLLDSVSAKIEDTIGRKLSKREKIHGHVNRPDMPMMEAMAFEQWSPIMPTPEDANVPLAVEIRAAQDRVDEAALFRAMGTATPEEKELLLLQRTQSQEVRRLAEEGDYAAQLRDRDVWIQDLEALKAEMALDTNYTSADMARVDQALAQCREPGSCRVAAEKLATGVLGLRGAVQDSILATVEDQVREASENLKDMRMAFGLPGVETKIPDASSPSSDLDYVNDPRWAELEKQLDGLMGHASEFDAAISEMNTIEARFKS